MPLDFEIPTDLWSQGERAPGSALLGFTVAFEQQNIPVLHDRLLEISDPRHADYGMWLSKEEVDDLTNPSPAVRSEVVRFLTLNLAPAFIKDHGDHVQVVASVESLESLFRMEFYVWESTAASVEGKKERAIVSPSDYFLPAELDIVLFLSGLTGFPVPHERRLGVHRSLDLTKRDDQDGKVSPSVVNNVYNIDPTSIPKNANASLCLAEFQNDNSYSPDDLATFDGQNLLPTTNVAFIIGSLSYTPPDMEATLDVQYGAAIAYNATIWYWSNAGWMYDFTVALSNRAHMPLVVSISWGWTETAQCRIASCNGVGNDQYITATDANWLKIVARGTTVVASSGDQGAPGDGNRDCINQRTPLTVMYPSVSPYILSVGATMLVEPETQPAPPADQTPMCASVGGCSQSTTETTCSYPNALITTGGGFSTIEVQPSWQASAVASYVNTYGSQLPPSSLYNARNRANPDVAGLGHNYVIIVDNKYELVDGTSCSAPVWGGIISLLNQGLMANGKPSLGFINPLLYQLAVSTPAVFNDITTGDNKCTEKCCSQYGYPATPGWDASTGLGSPNFEKLYQAIVGTKA